VQLDPANPPVRYARKISKESSLFGGEEGEGTVTLSYPDKGDGDCPGFVFSTSDAKIDVNQAVEQCVAVARSRYSVNPEVRRIVARPAKQWVPDLDSIRSNGVGAEAPDSGIENSMAYRNPTPAISPRFK
jgi:hypothetical protein